MIDLSNYGEIIRLYKGNGQLAQPNVGSFYCTFEVSQFHNGDIRVLCEFSDDTSPPIGIVKQLTGNIKLNGVTNDGSSVIIEGNVLQTKISSFFGQSGSLELLYLITGNSRLKVGQVQSGEKTRVRFGIVNFFFWGTESQEIAPNSWKLSLLPLDLHGKKITIQQITQYDEQKKSIEALKGINVTCYAEVEVQTFAEIESVETIISCLCQLLTVARGTMVSFLYYDILAENGSVIYSEHYPAITRNYSSGELLEDVQPEDTKRFIETAYDKYLALDSVYQLHRVIHAWVDNRSTTFLETRALAVVVLIDYLSGKYATVSGRATIIDESSFEQYREEIEKKVRELLLTIIPNLSRAEADSMGVKSRSFNYRSFRNKLTKLLRHFEVPISEIEINDFIETRNHLVHYMEFRTENPADEFRQMVHLVDRLLLKMLGYSGRYVNTATYERDML
jgi:hypothetical protein